MVPSLWRPNHPKSMRANTWVTAYATTGSSPHLPPHRGSAQGRTRAPRTCRVNPQAAPARHVALQPMKNMVKCIALRTGLGNGLPTPLAHTGGMQSPQRRPGTVLVVTGAVADGASAQWIAARLWHGGQLQPTVAPTAPSETTMCIRGRAVVRAGATRPDCKFATLWWYRQTRSQVVAVHASTTTYVSPDTRATQEWPEGSTSTSPPAILLQFPQKATRNSRRVVCTCCL